MLCHIATCIAPPLVEVRAVMLCLRPPGVA